MKTILSRSADGCTIQNEHCVSILAFQAALWGVLGVQKVLHIYFGLWQVSFCFELDFKAAPSLIALHTQDFLLIHCVVIRKPRVWCMTSPTGLNSKQLETQFTLLICRGNSPLIDMAYAYG